MRKIWNKRFVWILTVCMVWGSLLSSAGCGTASVDPRGDGVLTVVATSFAGYDFARRLTADAPAGSVDVILLGKAGQDMHSFEPTAADITTLSRADILIEIGNEAWLDATLKASLNNAVVRVSMMGVCDTIDGEHDHSHGTEDGACALIDADEHVWLSTENAELIVAAVGDALMEVDAPNHTLWETNTAAYVDELKALSAEYAAMRAGAVRDTVLIADRYPFAYLMRQLDLTCHAAFPGCSSETSASFETQTALVKIAREQNLPYIFIMEGSDGKMADVIAAESGAEVLTLDSIQVVTDRSKTYIGIMRSNLEQLKKALC